MGSGKLLHLKEPHAVIGNKITIKISKIMLERFVHLRETAETDANSLCINPYKDIFYSTHTNCAD